MKIDLTKGKKKKTQTAFRLDPELLTALKKWAKLDDRSLTSFVETALKDTINFEGRSNRLNGIRNFIKNNENHSFQTKVKEREKKTYPRKSN